MGVYSLMCDSKNRTINVKKNIIYSFILKAFGCILSFLLLPLTVNYLNVTEYGVWVTLFTVMNWVNMLDMGMGLGLRNKLAEAVAKKNFSLAKDYIATGFFSMIVLGLVLFVGFYIFINIVSFHSIYNTVLIAEEKLYYATFWTGFFVIVTFVLSIVNHFYYAWQKAAIGSSVNVLHNFIMLVIVYYLTLENEHDLNYFVFSYGFAAISSRILYILIFFYKHRYVLPTLANIRIKYIRHICDLGIKFFIIQISSIVMFSAANVLIAQKLGVESVQEYDVTYKIFSIVTLVHSILCAPLWNAYTEAWINKDYKWIKNTIRKLIFFMLPVIIFTIIIAISLNLILKIMIGSIVMADFIMIIGISFNVILCCWMNIWTYFLNGIGLVNMQMFVTVIGSLILIPLSWYLMDIFNSAGMIIASDVCLFLECIPLMFQVKKLIWRL